MSCGRPGTSEVFNEGYKVDNVKARVALDVEWNAKDGNLDRDISAYRALYEAGIIDGAVMITRTQDDLRSLAERLALEAGQSPEAARASLRLSGPFVTLPQGCWKEIPGDGGTRA